MKTKIMYFGTSHCLKDITTRDFEFTGTVVERVESYKYLGIMLDNKLRFDKYINYLCGKIYPKLKMLSRIRRNIGQGTAVYLYNCLINPLFAFGDYIFDAITQADSNKLQVLQNNCIRV